MTLNELRERYLSFYKDKGHQVIPSAPLIPENDPTTLFTGSGMQPLVPYLLGEKHPLGSRLTDSQKSFRAEDIEEVGDNRHTTFFEMLGNWSLGDYFKEEQLPWVFEFLTDKEKGVGLDPKRLYVSVFSGDEKNGISKDTQSVEIWQRLFKEKGIEAKDVELITEERAGQVGMQGGRIFYYNAKKNWWSRSGIPDNMPAGEPGGPDSEIFFEFENIIHDIKFGEHCHPNCDCGRFMEIGNSVFMEYKKTPDGFEKLAQRNVDFGGGLERMAAASENDPDVFHVDVFEHMAKAMSADIRAMSGDDIRKARIILDHLRAAIFLCSDGVEPSNKGQGYVLRRLLRRSALFARSFKLVEGWQSSVIDSVVDFYKGAYPDLDSRNADIRASILSEFSKFNAVVENGMKEFDKLVLHGVVTGRDAFNLHQSYGFPWELTEELAVQRGIKVDRKEFEEEFKKHQELSRTASAGAFKGGLADHSEKVVRYHTATHLMNAALRKVLGTHVMQKGSNITQERTRFDFTHSEKMTPEQLRHVEELVNGWIVRDLEVKKDIMPLEEARKLEAIGAFGEKYPDTVSVYTVLDPNSGEVVSREFCGGPHVSHTSEIGKFKIQKEEASSAGVRRIKAVIED